MAVVDGIVEVERSGRVYNNKGGLEVVAFGFVVVGGVILIFLEESFMLSSCEEMGVVSIEVMGDGIGRGDVMGEVIRGWRGRTG